jgi:hypothetical protein
MVGQPASVMRNGPNPLLSSGTSWATPQLAGWAACLMQTSTTLTPYQVRTAIQKSAHVYNNPGVQLGYGVPNFHTALDYLNIKDLPAMPDNNDWLKVSPNPFDKELTIRVYSERNSSVEISLTDVTGKVIYSTTADASTGVRTIQPEMPELTPGIYFLKAVMGEKEMVQQLLKR